MRKDLLRKQAERIGMEFITQEGCKCRVVDYINNKKVQVIFLDEYEWITWVRWDNLKKGVLKNPFYKSVCGVGYLGIDKNGEVPKTSINGKNTREYMVWKHMIERCYSGNYKTYENCTVCQRWLCFANFLEDISKIKGYELWRNNPKQKIALNKDIYYTELGIKTDCKEYSLETTRFIPQSENIKEVHTRKGL